MLEEMVKNQSFPEKSKHMYICKEWFKLIKKGFKYGVMLFSVQNDLKYLRYDATMEFLNDEINYDMIQLWSPVLPCTE